MPNWKKPISEQIRQRNQATQSGIFWSGAGLRGQIMLSLTLVAAAFL
jgi:hypothetical protein